MLTDEMILQLVIVTADIMLMQCVRVIGIKIMSLYVLDYWDTGVLFSRALLTETIL